MGWLTVDFVFYLRIFFYMKSYYKMGQIANLQLDTYFGEPLLPVACHYRLIKKEELPSWREIVCKD